MVRREEGVTGEGRRRRHAFLLACLAALAGGAGAAPAVTFTNIAAAPEDDNVLRALVTFESDVPVSARVVWRGAGEPFHRTDCGPVGTQHDAVIWGLRAQSLIRYRVQTCDGSARSDFLTFTTGALPGTLPALSLAHPCAACDTALVLFSAEDVRGIEGIYVADAQGRLVWYEEAADLYEAYDFAGGGEGLVWVTRQSEILKVGFDGVPVVHLTRPGSGYGSENLPADRCLHHEVYEREDGSLAVLTADPFPYTDGETTIDYREDGVAIFAADGTLAGGLEQMLQRIVAADGLLPTEIGHQQPSDFFAACGQPDQVNWGHGNTLRELGDGRYLVNLRDWGTRERGQVLYLDGEGNKIWALGDEGDFALETGVWFRGEHHAQVLDYHADGQPRTILLYDNRGVATSRILKLELTYDGGLPATAAIVDEVNLGVKCPFKGSAYETASGHLLATCPAEGTILEIDWEYVPGASTPHWQLDVLRAPDTGCADDCGNPGIYRAIPAATIFPFDP